MNDTQTGERLPFSKDVLLFKSQHKTIGHTNWRVIVYERPEVFHYNSGNPQTYAERYTGYQFWTGTEWKRETEHPRYDYNDGTYAGLPKGLRTLFYENQVVIEYHLHNEYPMVAGEGAPQYTFDIPAETQLSLL
jgi:hypothetical protein